MKTQTYIQVTTPCNEDWNLMSTAEKGRFCEKCASQVVDFTVLTDHQVLAYLASSKGNVCGRFNENQLNRGLHDTNIKRKKIWQWALTGFTSLFFASKGFSQNNFEKQLAKAELLSNNKADALKEISGTTTIKGFVVDELNARLQRATIIEPETLNQVLVNRTGNFVMQIDAKTEAVLVQAKGYTSRVVPVSMLNSSDTSITLIKADTSSTDIQGFDKKAFNGDNVIMGGITAFSKIEKPTTVTTFVKKIFNKSFFKLSPNPVANGSVSISVSEAGQYTFQLFDNNSKLLHSAEITVNDKGQIVKVTLPNCVSKGTYYVRLIDVKTKKEYVDKLIVQ